MSNIQTKFLIEENTNSKSFNFTELTGQFSTNNLTGWGSPNEEISNIDSVKLKILMPNEENFIEIDLSDMFPSADSSIVKTITNTDVGLSSTDSLPDGTWYFEYIVVMSDSTITSTNYFFFYAGVACCLNNKIKDFDLCVVIDLCNNKEIKNTFTMVYLLKAAEFSAECGNKNKANSILNIIENFCSC